MASSRRGSATSLSPTASSSACAFTAAPSDGRVEYAYFTFPDFDEAAFAVIALPLRNASTTILERLGYILVGTDDHAEGGALWRWELQPHWSSGETERRSS